MLEQQIKLKLDFETEYCPNFGDVPERLLMYSLATMIKAKVIVELGVAFGDGLYWLCKAAEATGGHAYGFDCWDKHGENTQFPQLGSQQLVEEKLHKAGLSAFTLHQVNTKDKEFNLARYIPGPIDLASIDGDHSYDGVKKDFENCDNKLSEHGIILLHDCMIIDGVRQFMLELEKSQKYFMHTLPYGAGERNAGLTIIQKKTSSGVMMDEQCGAPKTPQQIYTEEKDYWGFRR